MLLGSASRLSSYDDPTGPRVLDDDALAPLAEAALSSSMPSSDGLAFPLGGHLRSLSDGGAPAFNGATTTDSYDVLHLSLGGYRDDPFRPQSQSLARASRRRRTDPVYVREPTIADVSEHDRRKEVERKELIEMLLASVVSVPMALEKIHTNARLLSALEHEMGGEHTLLNQLLKKNNAKGAAWPDSELTADDEDENDDEDDDEEEEEEEEDDSSDYDSEYENDLAEAVNQPVMSEATLSSAERQVSASIGIDKQRDDRTSSSPQSSLFGASPGACSQDGEPVAALWPRQPHQFAFTQEEEEEEVGARVQDEVYSEMVGSLCEDESFLEGEEMELAHVDELEKVFEMDDTDEDDHELEYHQHILDSPSPAGAVLNAFTTTDDTATGLDNDEDDDEEEDENEDQEYDVFELRVFREKERTGFEANEDWRPRIGSLVGGRYRVHLEIGEAVFSRTFKGMDTLSGDSVCLKVIKNSKEFFDQGIDEIRVLQYISAHCDVDEKHLVRLLDFFYFREHLIIVTELLRDNLYEFSKLLLDRGNINYFSMPRLKKVAIEVLEALDVLHSIGLVHCDLKPENILISNFNECRIKVIDFGSTCFVTDELTSYVQSRSYRAPEVILGLGYDQKIDLWSLGCVLAELFTGEVLFKNDSEQSLLERIIGAIGPIPRDLLLENSELDMQFRENPSFALDAATGDGVLSPLHAPLPSLEALVQTSDAQFLDFLRSILQIHPNDRASAAEALEHPWLQSGVFSRSALSGRT